MNDHMTRRGLLHASGCVLCTLSSLTARAEQPLFQGCLISPAGYQDFLAQGNGLFRSTDSLIARNRYFRTTGNVTLDRDLDHALGNIADLFQVNPAFGFYDPAQFRNIGGFEANIMNAFATPENTDIPGTRCTVAFGWDLFEREYYQFDNTGTTIMAIAAHEFGHVVQSNRGYLNQLRVGHPMKSEINADYLSGYFLGVRKLKNSAVTLHPAGKLFERIGELGPLRTHGSPQERLDAAEAGFRVAYLDKKSLDDAVRAGLEYVDT